MEPLSFGGVLVDARDGLFVAPVRNYPLYRKAIDVTSAPCSIDGWSVRGAIGVVAVGALASARIKSGDDCRSSGRQSRMVILMAQPHAKPGQVVDLRPLGSQFCPKISTCNPLLKIRRIVRSIIAMGRNLKLEVIARRRNSNSSRLSESRGRTARIPVF
jgi:hypothetical protein